MTMTNEEILALAVSRRSRISRVSCFQSLGYKTMLVDHKFSERLARRNGRTQRVCEWYEEQDPMRPAKGIVWALLISIASWCLAAVILLWK